MRFRHPIPVFRSCYEIACFEAVNLSNNMTCYEQSVACLLWAPLFERPAFNICEAES